MSPFTLGTALASTLLLTACSFSCSTSSCWSAPPGSERAERVLEDSIAAPAELARIDVANPVGSITIQADGDGAVRYTARVVGWAPTMTRAEEIAQAVAPTVELMSDQLRVGAEVSDLSGENGAGYSIHWTIHAPPGLFLRADTTAGDVEAAGPFAGCDLTSDFGDVAARQGTGRVDLRTSSGDVRLADLTSATSVDVESSFGDVELTRIDADKVGARTSSGSIKLVSVTSAADISAVSSFGDVTATDCSANIELRTSSGDVTIQRHVGRVVHAASSFGDVSVSGRVEVVQARSNSGDVTIRAAQGSACSDAWNVETSFGRVDVALSPDISAELTAETNFGDVRCELTNVTVGQLGVSGKALDVRLGDGGPRITLRSSSGDVVIRASREDS